MKNYALLSCKCLNDGIDKGSMYTVTEEEFGYTPS